MPYRAQRFIHAANLRLDVPVSVHFSEQLTDDLRHALEDATLTALDTIIERCLHLNVDFLLLSGNVFLESDRSLRARLAMQQGFEQLREAEIPVFVLPGEGDPPEAWRKIPEMPGNVIVCYPSSTEPEYLVRDEEAVTAVSSSMWYGAADAFGIQVIGRSDTGTDPVRVGVVSRARFDESRKMESLKGAADDELLAAVASESETAASDHATFTVAEYEEAFRDYIEQLMTEGHLNYVCYMGELERRTLSLAGGKVHCPGTTQPRSQIECDAGTCSLVTVDGAGEISIEQMNTSAVDWKNIDLFVDSDATLNTSLQQMKALLLDQPYNDSDRVWAVRWTVRGPLPVIQNFVEEDLELAVTVELEEFEIRGQRLRLIHEVRTLPDPWEVPDKDSQAQQFADLLTEDAIVSRRKLMSLVKRDRTLTPGWQQRFESLVAGVDRERVLAKMRVDGAAWFVGDVQTLLPDLDDFDEDILQDEPVDPVDLQGDEDTPAEGVETALAAAVQEEDDTDTVEEMSLDEEAEETANEDDLNNHDQNDKQNENKS